MVVVGTHNLPVTEPLTKKYGRLGVATFGRRVNLAMMGLHAYVVLEIWRSLERMDACLYVVDSQRKEG